MQHILLLLDNEKTTFTGSPVLVSVSRLVHMELRLTHDKLCFHVMETLLFYTFILDEYRKFKPFALYVEVLVLKM